MATSASASNQPFIPAPGQAWLGDKVTAVPEINSQRLTAAGGFAIGGNIPTVALASGSGTGAAAAIRNVSGYDQAASFTLVAGVGAIQGGTLATVTFGQPFDVAPISATVNMYAPTGTVGLPVGAFALSATGFSIGGQAPVSGGTYSVNYFVVRSPL